MCEAQDEQIKTKNTGHHIKTIIPIKYKATYQVISSQ
jgi:hypothetical protein